MIFRISGQKINIMKNIMKSHMSAVKLKIKPRKWSINQVKTLY